MVQLAKFQVEMACEGCSKAIQRVLGRIDGVENVECDLNAQEVRVRGEADVSLLTEKLEKWGNAANKTVKLAAVVECV